MTEEERERMMVIAENAAVMSDIYGEQHRIVVLLHEALAALAAESVRRRQDDERA